MVVSTCVIWGNWGLGGGYGRGEMDSLRVAMTGYNSTGYRWKGIISGSLCCLEEHLLAVCHIDLFLISLYQ